MAKAPSLVNLCATTLKSYILHGDDDEILQGIYELPTELFDCLLNQLPPLALQRLQSQMPSEKQSEFCEYDYAGNGRKRVRYGKFDMAWMELFYMRWRPKILEHNQVKSWGEKNEVGQETVCDWQQKYWEMHLQNCFDAAAERAMLPSFDQCIGLIELPVALIEAIGYEERVKCSNLDYSKLHSHCQEFGSHMRFLRLQNVFCNPEISDLIARSKLKGLVLRRISSQMHADGLCQILNQNIETIESLEFANCKISSSFVESICQALCVKRTKTYGIKHFAVQSSKLLEENPSSLPPNFLTIISSRSLESLRFSDSHIQRNCAKLIFTTLIEASSALSIFELSDNNISGWLSDYRCEVSNQGLPSRDISKCLKSLRLLNLRGNNLRVSDIVDLRSALVYMPVLENLDLSDNPLENNGIKSLIPYFVKTIVDQVPLANLNLKNCKISCSGATELLEVLCALKYPLSSLSLADNDLGSQIAPALGDFLRTSIKFLDIREVGLGSAGFLELQINMPEVVNLINIDISENRGGIQAAEFLKELICRAPELLVVCAGFNLMPSESLEIICSAFDVGKGKLHCVDLLGNQKLSRDTHAVVLAKIQESGGPSILVQPSSSQDTPYDDDP